MRTVQILEQNDRISPTDWARPLQITSTGDSVFLTSEYGGLPQNNMTWIRVYACLSQCWHGKTVAEVCREVEAYEFLRGTPPEAHQHLEQKPIPGFTFRR